MNLDYFREIKKKRPLRGELNPDSSRQITENHLVPLEYI